MSGTDESEYGWLFKVLKYSVPWVRKLGFRKTLHQIRRHCVTQTLKAVHHHIIHELRMARGRLDPSEALVAERSQKVLTNSARMMAELCEVERNKMHCCIKLLEKVAPNQQKPGPPQHGGKRRKKEQPSEKPEPLRVTTWVRSEPFDQRGKDIGADNAVRICTNSVWCCLQDRDDGKTRWSGFTAFSCNDLQRESHRWQCERANWADFYKACVVFPIRLPLSRHQYLNIGFLAFDSPQAGAFRGVPNIYDHLQDPTGYKEKLDKSAVFHLGGLLADTIAAVLGPYILDTLGREHGTADQGARIQGGSDQERRPGRSSGEERQR